MSEVLAAFNAFAEAYYRKDGVPTGEAKEYGYAARIVRELYSPAPAAAFDVLALAAVRDAMVARGWCRRRVNKQVGRVKRIFKWAASRKLVPASLVAEHATLDGLKAGRSAAPERGPVEPVPDADVEATLPFLRPPVRAMVRLQRLTGMRPGEVCRLTLGRLDRSADPWVYRPGRHKTEHHGKGRAVYIGPRGQAALLDFLAGRVPSPDEFVFSPARDKEVRHAEWRRNRKSKVPPSQQNRRKATPARAPGERYTPMAYAHAVAKACEKAGVPPWSPNRLRHSRATEVRGRYGLEAAQVVLGHSQLKTAEVYAEKNGTLAAMVAAEAG